MKCMKYPKVILRKHLCLSAGFTRTANINAGIHTAFLTEKQDMHIGRTITNTPLPFCAPNISEAAFLTSSSFRKHS